MKRPCAVLIVLALVAFWAAFWAVPGPGGGARADYVFFYRTIGGWTVVCSQDTAGRNACSLSAPPPVQGGDSQSLVSVIAADDGLAVGARVRAVIDENRPVTLAVDGGGAFDVRGNRYGEARWRGRAARSLIGRMKDGKRLTLSYTLAAGAAAVEYLSLAGFAEALALWQRRSRTLGLFRP